jgi:hypothetical protein
VTILLIGFFDAFLFPGSMLHEEQFNPAYLHERKFEVMLGSEQRFELPELRTAMVYSQVGQYSVRASSFGHDLYRESILEFNAGFAVTENVALGFGIAGMNCLIRDVCNDFTYSIKAGGLLNVGDLSVSTWVNNVNVPRVSAVDCAPVSYAVRLDHRPRANLGLNLSVRGVADGMPFYTCGILFAPHGIMLLGLGVSTKPFLFEYGMKLSPGTVFFSYSGSRHPQLGMTHFFTVGFTQ